MRVNEYRRFIRHALQVPIAVIPEENSIYHQNNSTQNISHGGLAFQSERCWEIGRWIHIRIELLRPPYEAHVQVVWCRQRHNDLFLVGVQFADEREAFKARMVEQLCRIELYRRRQNAKGRPINGQQAASEWIEQHAARFCHLVQ